MLGFSLLTKQFIKSSISIGSVSVYVVVFFVSLVSSTLLIWNKQHLSLVFQVLLIFYSVTESHLIPFVKFMWTFNYSTFYHECSWILNLYGYICYHYLIFSKYKSPYEQLIPFNSLEPTIVICGLIMCVHVICVSNFPQSLQWVPELSKKSDE